LKPYGRSWNSWNRRRKPRIVDISPSSKVRIRTLRNLTKSYNR